MHQKAIVFGDMEIADKVLKARTPREQKALGRKVRNFDGAVWEVEGRKAVYRASHAKFTQNKTLLDVLMATDGTTLVEASPTDKIWGIGLDANDARAYSRETWCGTNWLGEVLTQLREDLKAQSLA